MKPHIGISEKKLANTASILSVVLADEMTLYVKTRKFHWNIYGESFMELHKLFENQYKQLEEIVDEVAERINKLGEQTIGTMKEFLSLTSIKESAGKYPKQNEMLHELLADHETVIVQLRKYIDKQQKESIDAGTIDFITGLLQQHETISWILRRYLK